MILLRYCSPTLHPHHMMDTEGLEDLFPKTLHLLMDRTDIITPLVAHLIACMK
jgi:hypothetical protein